jgi:D-alanyl-D-alanine dipeptidase
MDGAQLPQGFVVLSKYVPDAIINLAYCGPDNLVGRPLRGYAPNGVAILTKEAALSLNKITNHLQTLAVKSELGLNNPTILILEAFRPQRASEDFWEWSQTPCEKTKQSYYPNINKKDFFKLGYIAKKSSHSRGSTVDLTIVDRLDNKIIPLDMGTPFDFMDHLSHPANKDISTVAIKTDNFYKS